MLLRRISEVRETNSYKLRITPEEILNLLVEKHPELRPMQEHLDKDLDVELVDTGDQGVVLTITVWWEESPTIYTNPNGTSTSKREKESFIKL